MLKPLLTAKGYIVTTLKEPRLVLHRKRYLLMLSHMRCYTSLLGHILGSHPEIDGSSETHLPYRNRIDLLKLKYRVYFLNKKINGKYIFDKILHNHPIAPEILDNPRVKILFALRLPDDAIRSIVNMALNLDRSHQVAEFRDPRNVLNYYVGRLDTLKQQCQGMKARALYIDADDLLSQTDRVFTFLKRELKLSQDLSENYETFDHTGQPQAGDVSSRIKSGKIDRKKSDFREIEIPDDILARAREAHDSCRTVLRERCLSPSS
jgi:hypothetical protein